MAKLRSRRIPDSQIGRITSLVRDKHYQLACREYFKITHRTDDAERVGNHPNTYFEESQALLQGSRPAPESTT